MSGLESDRQISVQNHFLCDATCHIRADEIVYTLWHLDVAAEDRLKFKVRLAGVCLKSAHTFSRSPTPIPYATETRKKLIRKKI